MSTDYGWEGLRQVCATLLGVRHVPERLCGGLGYLGRYNKIFYAYPKMIGAKMVFVGFISGKGQSANFVATCLV